MMPKAGGQYVYLREALGADLGIFVWMDAVPGDPDGDDCGGGSGVREVSGGVLSERFCQTNWIWHVGAGNVGLNTANLVAIGVIITLLTVLNTRGVKLGAAVQNVFTSREGAGVAGGGRRWGWWRRNAAAIAANFGAGWTNFWAGVGLGVVHYDYGRVDPAGWCGCDRCCGGVDGGGGGAGGVAVFERCVEQRDVYGGGDSRIRSAICR